MLRAFVEVIACCRDALGVAGSEFCPAQPLGEFVVRGRGEVPGDGDPVVLIDQFRRCRFRAADQCGQLGDGDAGLGGDGLELGADMVRVSGVGRC